MSEEGNKKSEEGKAEGGADKPHVCSVCAKPSETVICFHCETNIRAEAFGHKHEVEKGR